MERKLLFGDVEAIELQHEVLELRVQIDEPYASAVSGERLRLPCENASSSK